MKRHSTDIEHLTDDDDGGVVSTSKTVGGEGDAVGIKKTKPKKSTKREKKGKNDTRRSGKVNSRKGREERGLMREAGIFNPYYGSIGGGAAASSASCSSQLGGGRIFTRSAMDE